MAGRAVVALAVALGAFASAAWTGPVVAQGGDEAACAPILHALRALATAPRYHWTMSATTPGRRRPVEREQVVIGDIVYLTPDEGRWMKQRIAAPERASRMEDELARSPPRDCGPGEAEARDGVPMLAYGYRQGTAQKRIWVGVADGLPRFFTSSEGVIAVKMRVSYEPVAAPLP